MGVYTNIYAALNTRLATLTANPIAWPNVRYVPTEGNTYLRPTLLPAATELNTQLGTQKHQGIYQVDIYVPSEKGLSAITTIMDAIDTLFSSDRILEAGSNRVYIQQIGIGNIMQQEAWYSGYVSINYLCYT